MSPSKISASPDPSSALVSAKLLSSKLPRRVCVVMHDVAPATWPACRQLLDALDEVEEVPVTFLVVPHYHGGRAVQEDREFIAAMSARISRGDELALHGYRHYDPEIPHGMKDIIMRRLYTAGEGEFSSLTEDVARTFIQHGVDCFTENDWPLRGFVAPAWLMSEGTWEALADFPFSYVTTLRRLVLLPERTEVIAPSLTYSTRTMLRRQVSHLWNRQLMLVEHSEPAIRLGLHPADAHHPDVVRQWQHILEQCLEDRTAITKTELADRCRDAIGASSDARPSETTSSAAHQIAV